MTTYLLQFESRIDNGPRVVGPFDTRELAGDHAVRLARPGWQGNFSVVPITAPEDDKPRTPCPRCEGCGQLANDDERTPWTFWANLKPPSNMAVVVGMVRPEPCDECAGTGKVSVSA